MTQMEAAVRPPTVPSPFTMGLGGAVTLAGPIPNGGVQPIFPNSNNFIINGNDANSCHQAASSAKPAIGAYDNQSQTNIINALGKPQNYVGAGGTPSVENVYAAIGGAGATPSALDGLVQSMEGYATTPVLAGNVSSLPATTTSSVTVVDGTCH